MWCYQMPNKPQIAVRRGNGPPWEERMTTGFVAELEIPKEIADAIDHAPRSHRIVDGNLERTTDDGQTWEVVPIVLPVPAKITRWQGRKWLNNAGLLVTIEAAIQAGGLDARIEYEAGEWYRASEFLRVMATALLPDGTDVDAWLDQMFREASTL